LQDAKEKFMASMCEDLNIAGAIGILSEAVGAYSTDADPIYGDTPHTLGDELRALQAMDAILGVLELDDDVCTNDLDIATIESLIEARLDARSNKNWSRADELRDELSAMGIEIKDGPDGTTWTRVVQ
jgi:cysteinyl-tRNA synthetase